MDKENNSLLTKLLTIVWEIFGFTYENKEVVIEACENYSYILEDQNVVSAINEQNLGKLIEALNNGDESKYNILHAACRDGNFKLVETLLKLGLDSNAMTLYCKIIPLNSAVLYGHTKIVRLLLENRADPRLHSDSSNWTLLHVAANNNYPEIIKLLIQYGLNPNTQATGAVLGGMTPLHSACNHNNMEAVEALLKNGANPNIKDKDGKKPAEYTKNPLIINLLDSQGILPAYDQLDPPAYEQNISNILRSSQVDANPPPYETITFD